MKRVLIVTPNWPPVSCPDLHRVRTTLPYLNEFGWEPLLLKINPDEQEGIKDPFLCRSVPDTVTVRQAGCIPLKMTSWCGIRSVGLRSHFHLAFAGSRMIKDFAPRVVFFSTTMFPVMTLGAYWWRRFGIPYVLDFQDPWWNGPIDPPAARGRKYALSQVAAGWLEPMALSRATHVVSVSPTYAATLQQRYRWLEQRQFTVLPFGAPEEDFELLRRAPIQQTIFDPRDGKQHWVYVGRGGADMHLALSALFNALKQIVDERPGIREGVRLHFVGTDYAPDDRAIKTVEPIAAAEGVADMVSERTERIPYFEALQCLLDAHALVMPGSIDAGYVASKLLPYIIAAKPMLAIFNRDSLVVDLIGSTRAGTVVPFEPEESVGTIARRLIDSGWLIAPPVPDTVWSAVKDHSAREMTRRLCDVFDKSSVN